MEWGVIISAAGLAVLVLTTSGGMVWKLSRIEVSIRAEYSEEITVLRAKYIEEVAAMRAEHVREIAALSGKLYQVEIWSRDEFVRKGSFEMAITRMEKGFGDLRNEIFQRLDKVAERIEHINHAER